MNLLFQPLKIRVPFFLNITNTVNKALSPVHKPFGFLVKLEFLFTLLLLDLQNIYFAKAD